MSRPLTQTIKAKDVHLGDRITHGRSVGTVIQVDTTDRDPIVVIHYTADDGEDRRLLLSRATDIEVTR